MASLPSWLPLSRRGLEPVPELVRLCCDRPVAPIDVPFGMPAWLITGYQEVWAVLGDAGRFSNEVDAHAGPALAEAIRGWSPEGLGFHDPPSHTRLRRLLSAEFSAHRLRPLRPRVEALVAGRLDDMERRGPPVDLVEAFALPIPSWVMCELLGVPETDRGTVQNLARGRFHFSGDLATSIATIRESVAFLTEVVARLRDHPGPGLLGRLLREHGGELDDRELAGLADGLLTGGHETTASMLALGTVLLLGRPEHAASVRNGGAGSDRVLEELLRYLAVAQLAFPRFARIATELAGERIRAGDMLLCSLSAANRDPALGASADGFDPAGTRPHVAFGHGIHHCLGAPLARLEMQVAYPALLARFPGLRLAVPFSELPFAASSVVYGVDSVPVSW